MSIVDIGIILFILCFIIVGAKQGLIKSGVSLVALIVVFVISYVFKEHIGNFLCKYLPFFNFSGNIEGLVSLNILIYQLAGFFIILAVLMGIYTIVMTLSGWIQKLVNMTILLKLPSSIGGAIVGLVEGYLIAFIILLIAMIPMQTMTIFKDSKVADFILHKTPIVSESTSDITNSVNEIYTLVDQVVNKEIGINEANLKSIDIMIKHKIITPHTVEQLVVLDKLEEVEGLEHVLNRYE